MPKDLLSFLAGTYATEFPDYFLAITHHRNTHGNPMTFTDSPWAVDIYKDKSHDIRIMKSVQCGISEYLRVKTFAACANGRAVLYVLPTDTDCAKVVNGCIVPLIENVPTYKAGVGRTDNIRMKRLWRGRVFFGSSGTKNTFKEMAAQVLIVDELDECNQTNLAFAGDRLASARQRTGQEPDKIRVSNPSIPNYGIDELFSKSNKQFWHLHCSSCNTWQPLDWFVHFVRQEEAGCYSLLDSDWTEGSGRDIMPFCSKCGKPLDRLSCEAQWVAENFERKDISGYHVSKLFTAQTTMAEVYDDFLAALNSVPKTENFYNSTLGLPYADEGNHLSEAILASCADPEWYMPATAEEAVAGVDVGNVFHVKISKVRDKKRVAVFIGTVPTWDELERLFAQYNVHTAVIDIAPETHKAKEFRAKSNVNVYLCRYYRSPNEGDTKVDNIEGEIIADKHQSLDESYDAYIKRNVILPADFRTIDGGDFVAQMGAPIRKYTPYGTSGILLATWVEGNKADHYRHADTYEMMAFNLAYHNQPRIT